MCVCVFISKTIYSFYFFFKSKQVSCLFVFRPHCMTALLDLISLTNSLISKRSKSEECLTLNSSLLKILRWLLSFFSAFVESSNRGGQIPAILLNNGKKTFEILTDMYQDEFIFNLLYVAKVEDKDGYSKIVATECKKIDTMMTSKTSPASNDLKSFYVPETILGLRTLDPMKNEAKPVSIASELPSFVHTVQPMLVFEALFRPASDLNSLSQYLNTLRFV